VVTSARGKKGEVLKGKKEEEKGGGGKESRKLIIFDFFAGGASSRRGDEGKRKGEEEEGKNLSAAQFPCKKVWRGRHSEKKGKKRKGPTFNSRMEFSVIDGQRAGPGKKIKKGRGRRGKKKGGRVRVNSMCPARSIVNARGV